MNGFEFIHGSHASKFQRIVFVGLSFDVGPFPGVFVGGADECFEAKALSQIVDPAGRTAGLHDDQVDFVFFEDGGEIISFGGGIEKGVFASFRIEKAAHGIEFTEVESENSHGYCSLGLGSEIETDIHVSASRV